MFWIKIRLAAKSTVKTILLTLYLQPQIAIEQTWKLPLVRLKRRRRRSSLLSDVKIFKLGKIGIIKICISCSLSLSLAAKAATSLEAICEIGFICLFHSTHPYVDEQICRHRCLSRSCRIREVKSMLFSTRQPTEPWSSLVEGYEGPKSGKLLWLWQTPKNCASHALQHSILIWLLGWSVYSSPST